MFVRVILVPGLEAAWRVETQNITFQREWLLCVIIVTPYCDRGGDSGGGKEGTSEDQAIFY